MINLREIARINVSPYPVYFIHAVAVIDNELYIGFLAYDTEQGNSEVLVQSQITGKWAYANDAQFDNESLIIMASYALFSCDGMFYEGRENHTVLYDCNNGALAIISSEGDSNE